MLDPTDSAIIAFAQYQIAADLEAADLVPAGPWTVDVSEPSLTGNGTPPVVTGYPQLIKPASLPGVTAEPILIAYDPEGTPAVTAPYVVMAADPDTTRTRLNAALARLGMCHQYLSSAADAGTEPPGFLREMIRLEAVAYATRDGYQAQAWAPRNLPVSAGR
jgi:hypothetical protein